MSPPGGQETFRAVYASALGGYLGDPSEASLRVAYELGREAVGRRLSMLELAVAHQEALQSVLDHVSGEDATRRAARAAGDFLVESLSSFEMVQRGLDEARDAFSRQRRQTELSRRLSTFLTDASLARDVSESLQEILRLVSEQARELVAAECCLTTLSLEGRPRAVEAASHPEPDTRWEALLRWVDVVEIYALIHRHGGAVRLIADDLTVLPEFRQSHRGRPLRGWLAVSLTALDGSEIGAIQLFDRQDGDFTPDDQASLVYLAQMASAAVERVRLYQPPA